MDTTTKPFKMSFLVGSNEEIAIRKTIEMGIDSHLEGFTDCKFEIRDTRVGPRLYCEFAPGTLKTLIRRLQEVGESVDKNGEQPPYAEEALMLIDSICTIANHYGDKLD
jgi:hypothetical protein